MKRPSWPVTLLIIACLIAVFTNPSTEEHKQAVKSVINAHVQNSISEHDSDGIRNLGILLGSSLAEKLVEDSITRENYLLFSITRATWKGETKSIGYGVFGNVFISEDIKERMNDSNDYSYN